MPALNDQFPWASHYGHFKFFEERMREHNIVTSLTALDNGLYELEREHGDTLRVFICECYSYGVAEFFESNEKLGPLHAVIINSNWCAYTDEAKRHCRDQEVGLFNIGEFMAALSMPDFWSYLSDPQKERFQNNGWL